MKIRNAINYRMANQLYWIILNTTQEKCQESYDKQRIEKKLKQQGL